MWKNAVFATGVTDLALAVALFGKMDFLLPYKRVLFHDHGRDMIVFAALLTVNLFFVYLCMARLIMTRDTGRKLILKESGYKLSNIESQISEGNIMHELSERLEN